MDKAMVHSFTSKRSALAILAMVAAVSSFGGKRCFEVVETHYTYEQRAPRRKGVRQRRKRRSGCPGPLFRVPQRSLAWSKLESQVG